MAGLLQQQQEHKNDENELKQKSAGQQESQAAWKQGPTVAGTGLVLFPKTQ